MHHKDRYIFFLKRNDALRFCRMIAESLADNTGHRALSTRQISQAINVLQSIDTN